MYHQSSTETFTLTCLQNYIHTDAHTNWKRWDFEIVMYFRSSKTGT